MRNRYYVPTLGRWLTRDPIGYQGGIDLYEYVQSSPVGNVDAAGLAGWGAPPWGTMYTPPPTSVSDANLYGTGGGVAPLPNTSPSYPSGPDFGKVLLGKLAGYSIGSSVGFALKNTVLELPPPFGMVVAEMAAHGRIVSCTSARGPAGRMFVGRVSVGVGWGEGIVEKDTVSDETSSAPTRSGGLGTSRCRRCENTIKFDLVVYSETQAGFALFGLGGQATAGIYIGSYSFPNGPWRWDMTPFASVSGVSGDDLSAAFSVMGEAAGTGRLVLP